MNHNQKQSAIDSFKNDPISKIVIKNSIPALFAMVMVIVYNFADTFFLGLTKNYLMVTAVSYATPLFMVFMSLGTLFGVGGTSVISRALGEGKTEYAKKTCSFCMWSCVAVGGIMMAVLWIFIDKVTVILGADAESMQLTRDYLVVAIGCGVFSMLSNCFSSILRTEGESMKAMTGMFIGNLLNIILDPIFILAFNWGVAGAAVATVIGNAVSAGYYLLHFLKGKSVLSINPKYFSAKDKILSGVLSVGISASLANLLVSVTTIIVNIELSKFTGGNMLVAGNGVAGKVIMIITLIGIGIGSGVQPFLGYCYGAKEKDRLVQGIRFSAVFGLVTCAVATLICFIFAKPIVSAILEKDTPLESGVHFTRILLSTAWLIGAFAICQNTLQALGAATPALLASIFRQGVIFLPALFIMKSILGVDGLLWAQPVADVLSLGIIIVMLWFKIKKTDFTKDISCELSKQSVNN